MRVLSLFLMVFVGIEVLAQGQPTVADIKLSARYYWGEGFSTDRQQAIDLARQDLVQKMVVTITAEQNLKVVEDGTGNTSTFELRSKSLSRMQLRGLDYVVGQRRDQSYQATAFVSKLDFNQTMVELRNRILTQKSQMNAAIQRGNRSVAIAQAFDILVQTYFIPVPVFSDSIDVQSYVRSQLSAWLMDAEVTVPSVTNRSAPGHTELSLEASVRFGSELASDLLLQLNRPGYGEHPVRDGRADVFLDVEPELPNQNIEFRLMPVIPTSLDAELKTLAQDILPSRILLVPVNFKPVMMVDFTVSKLLGDGYRFAAQFQNVSVFDIQWNFGRGQTSTQASPKVELADIPAAGRPISLIINRSPELTLSKVLMPDGTLRSVGDSGTPVEPEQPEPEPVVVTPAPTPLPAPNTVMTIDLIALSQRNHLDPLLRIRNAAAFTDQLERLKQQNVVRYGRSSEVGPIERSYVAIVDPTDRSIKTVLTPLMNGVRYDLSNNEPVAPEAMRDRYQGMGSIWFSFN